VTDQPTTIASVLKEDEAELWQCAERGDPIAVNAATLRLNAAAPKSGADEARATLLTAMALLNAGQDVEAFKAAAPALTAPKPYDVWAKAERIYASRRTAKLKLADNDRLTLDEVQALEKESDPWSRFAAARAYLALGLVATQENRLSEALTLLDSSYVLMRSTDSQSGLASVFTALGKLKAWQGRGDETLLTLLSGLAIWRRLNEKNSVAIWHEVGAALVDSRHFDEGAAVLRAARVTVAAPSR